MKKEYFVCVENTVYPVTFSDEKEALLAAKAAGRAVLGLWDKNNPENIPTEIPYLVEEEAQITKVFLERLVRRQLKLPWIIAETKRLQIREFVPRDWKSLSVTVKESFAPALPPMFTDKEAFLSYLRCQYPFYEYGIWALEEKQQHQLIGGCGFWDRNDSDYSAYGDEGNGGGDDGNEDNDYSDEGAVEIGYWISPAFRHQGYGAEAVKAVLDYAFYLGKTSIYAEIREENIPSRKLAEKLNFISRPGQSGARKLRYQYVPYL